MKKLRTYICLMLYYAIARHLPGSDMIYSLGSKQIRRFLCKRIFKKAGKNINIEHGVFLVPVPILKLEITPAWD